MALIDSLKIEITKGNKLEICYYFWTRLKTFYIVLSVFCLTPVILFTVFSNKFQINVPGFIFSVLGIVMFYIIMARVINKTFMEMKDNKLKISYGPLPLFSSKEYDLTQMKELQLKQDISAFRPAIDYYIVMETKDCSKTILVQDIPKKDSATLIKQKIEKYIISFGN